MLVATLILMPTNVYVDANASRDVNANANTDVCVNPNANCNAT